MVATVPPTLSYSGGCSPGAFSDGVVIVALGPEAPCESPGKALGSDGTCVGPSFSFPVWSKTSGGGALDYFFRSASSDTYLIMASISSLDMSFKVFPGCMPLARRLLSLSAPYLAAFSAFRSALAAWPIPPLASS